VQPEVARLTGGGELEGPTTPMTETGRADVRSSQPPEFCRSRGLQGRGAWAKGGTGWERGGWERLGASDRRIGPEEIECLGASEPAGNAAD
jgi:hypothetical protein